MLLFTKERSFASSSFACYIVALLLVAATAFFPHPASAVCTTNQTWPLSPTELSTYPSTFDIDRSGDDYVADERCHWAIRCPSGYSVGIKMTVDTADANDFFEFYDEGLNTLLVPKVTGTNNKFHYLFHHAVVEVQFQSDAAGFAEGNLNKQVEYDCHEHKCHTNKKIDQFEVLNFQVGGTWAPNVVETVYDNEQCAFHLQCAANQFIYVYTPPAAFSGTTIKDDSGTDVDLKKGYEYNTISSLKITFVADMNDAAGHNFKLQWACGSKPTDDPCSGGGVTIEGPSVSYIPFPLSGSNTGMNNMNCKWKVTCSSGRIPRVTGWYSAYDPDVLRVLGADGTEWASLKHSNSNWRGIDAILERDAMIEYNSLYRDNRWDFHTRPLLQISCYNSACLTHSNQVFQNEFGKGPIRITTSYNNERCRWKITCKNPNDWIAWEHLSGSQPISVESETGTKFDTSNPTIRAGTAFVVLEGHDLSSRTSWQFRCIENMEGMCEVGQVDHYHSYGTNEAVTLPVSAYGGHYFNSVTCTFLLTCPTGWKIAVSGVAYTHNVSDYLTISDSHTKTRLLPKFYGHWGFATLLDTDSVDMVFQSDSEKTRKHGFYNFVFRCYLSQCTTNASDIFEHSYVDTPIRVTTKLGGEHCKWQLKCADPSLEIFFISISSGGGTLSFYDASTNQQFANPGSFKATKLNDIRMEFAADYYGGSVDVYWECIDHETKIWCGTDKADEEYFDFSGTITTPMHRDRYFDHLDCTYNIQCPNNLRLSLEGQIAFHNNDDYLQIMDETGTTELGRLSGNGGHTGSHVGGYRPRTVRYMWRKNKIKLKLHTDSDWGAGGLYYGLQWKCYVADCSSNLTTPTIKTHTAGDPATYVSRYFGNEVCTYQLNCTGKDDWLAFSGVTGTVSNMYFTTVDGAWAPKPNTSAKITTVPLLGHWDAPGLDTTFGFQYMCFDKYEYLNSPCAPDYTESLNEYTSTMTTPMSPFGTYFNNMLCSWNITCPVGMRIAVYGKIDANKWDRDDHIKLLDSSGTLQRQTRGVYTIRDVYHDNELGVRFVSDNLYAYKGISVTPALHYRCLIGKCSNNLTDYIDKATTVGSDLTVTSTYFHEACDYTLRCQNKNHWMYYRTLTNVASTVKLYDIDRDPVPMFQKDRTIPMNFVYFHYTSPLTYDQTFKIKFTCVYPYWECRTGKVRVISPTRTSPTGYITLPRAPNYKYPTDLLCSWRLQCPNPNGGIHIRGVFNSFNSSDNVTIYDKNMVATDVFYSTETTEHAFDYVFHGGTMSMIFSTDAEQGAYGFINPAYPRGTWNGASSLKYTCYEQTCATPYANEPVRYHSGDPINVTLGVEKDDCVINVQCYKPNHCLIFNNQSSNMTNVDFASITGIPVIWRDVLPIIIPVSKLLVKWKQYQPGHEWWFTFSCEPEPQPGFCTEVHNQNVRRLWGTFTLELTDTSTLPATPTMTTSITTSSTMSGTASATVSASISKSVSVSPTFSLTSTHELSTTESLALTLTVDPPPTTTATDTPTVTPPPTRTATFSRTPSPSISETTTHSESVSDSDSVSGSSTAVITSTESLTLGETVSISVSPTGEATSSVSASVSDSVPTQIRFTISPSRVGLSTMRGENPEESALFEISVQGTTFIADDGQEVDKLFETTRFSTFSVRGDPIENEYGFIARRNNLWKRTQINHTHTQIFLNFSTDPDFYIRDDEVVMIEFDATMFKYHEHSVPVRPVTFRVVEDLEVRPETQLEGIGSAAALASGVVSANGAAATKAARLGLLLDLAACHFDDSKPIGYMEYPLQHPLGPSGSNYRYRAGQMILNPALLMGIGLFHKMMGYVVACFKGVDMSEAHSLVFFPSYTFVPVVFLMQDSLSATWIVLIYHSSTTMQVLGAAMLLLLWIPVYAFVSKLVLRRERTFPAWFEPESKWNRVKQFLLGHGAWEDSPLKASAKGFCAKYGQIFACYRPGRIWFIAVELAFTLLYSIIGSIRPPTNNCNLLMYFLMALNALYLVLVTTLVPYIALCEQIIEFFIALLQCCSTAMIIVGLPYDPLSAERKRYNNIGLKCVEAVFMLLMAKAGLDILMLIQEQLDRVNQEKEELVDEKEITMLGKSSSGTPSRDGGSALLAVPDHSQGSPQPLLSPLLELELNPTTPQTEDTAVATTEVGERRPVESADMLFDGGDNPLPPTRTLGELLHVADIFSSSSSDDDPAAAQPSARVDIDDVDDIFNSSVEVSRSTSPSQSSSSGSSSRSADDGYTADDGYE